MSAAWRISRRTMLRGLGTAVALPLLDSMAPRIARAGAQTAQRPLRMAFVYVPNGINMADWTPKTTGADYDVPFVLEWLGVQRERHR